MKRLLAILILFSIHQCKSNDIRCQKYSDDSKSLEIYCENFREQLPEKCSENLDTIPYSANVTQLKIGACNFDMVLDIIDTYNDSIRVLDISQSGFMNLEWMSMISPLTRLEVLNVSHNQFERIPMEFVPNTPELREIDLSYNLLSDIDEDNRLKGAKKLEKVILSHNSIMQIHNQSFQESPNLHFIDLSSNKLHWTPKFPPNKRLRVMHLEGNAILDFDCSWIAKQNETSIHLDWAFVWSFDIEKTCRNRLIHIIRSDERDGVLIKSNGRIELHCRRQSFNSLAVFQAAPHAFDNIADIIECFGYAVQIIDLSNHIIGKIDPAVFDPFVKLQRLILRNTMLTEFDVLRYRNRQQLLALDLSYNNLKALKNISRLMNLQELDVAENLIENIPEIIDGLRSSVTYLDISGNFLGPVNQTTFDWINRLETLKLSNTAFSFNDSSPFEPLKDLLFLDISRNNLNTSNFDLLDETLGKLITFNASRCHIDGAAQIVRKLNRNIEEVDLTGNEWGELNANSLESLRALTVLNLSSTNLLSFDSALFWHLNKLVNLDLSYNRLKSIDLESLSSRVEWLNLEGNELVKIDHFAPRQKIALGISGNQLMCTDITNIKHNQKVTMIGDPSDQKHLQDCLSSKQSINDFLSTVYDKVVFW